ncbi:MAG: DUF1553 domain-containing protein [Planctomycetes bacterium]|nr:DUF1553 domain-containing protein [Planctomycetota bacterium]
MSKLPLSLALLILVGFDAGRSAMAETTVTAGAASAVSPLVQVEIVDRDVPVDRKWPEQFAEPSERYTEPAFAFIHLPWRYTETGVRADRGNPALLRATGTVELPAGKLRILLRSRNAARLRIGEQDVAQNDFLRPNPDGHGLIKTKVLTLGQTRFVGPGDRESLVEFDSPGGALPIKLEVFVGGVNGKKPLRPELGETYVAWAAGDSNEFVVFAPTRRIALTDAAWEKFAAERWAHYDQVETERRAAAFAAYAPFWRERHSVARRWVAAHPAPPVPKVSGDWPVANEIDQFLGTHWQRAKQAVAETSGTIRFHRDVLPLLKDRCQSCHGAAQPKGGLRLDSLEAMLRGGESGEPAVVTGQPAKSPLLERICSTDESMQMPPQGVRLRPEEVAKIEKWIAEGAAWPAIEPAYDVAISPLTDDAQFARRVYLDVVGVPPTADELRAFLKDDRADKRAKLIDELLADKRWADVWTARWQDWLGENPNLVNATLNNTGPFRFWLYESFRDNKAMDLFAWELVTMGGSVYGGGPAGFGLAAQNDAPMVAKAGVLSSTFLATEMKCARCHDAPYHASTQAELFHMAAMLARAPVKIPDTSSVPLEKLTAGGRQPLIRVSLRPGEVLAAEWPLTRYVSASAVDADANDPREQLAALLTSPKNERFAEVLVNRVWHHYFGQGLVESLNDWENARPAHPELLEWLARDLVAHDYDLKHLARRILNTRAYGRQSSPDRAANRLYAAPPRRRLSAEQTLDSLFASFGVPLVTEAMCIDLDSGRPADNGLNLGRPQRAWQFTYLSNERDRPSLNLPRAQAVAELLGAFGWSGNRQEAVSERKVEPSVLQAALLANGTVARWLTRVSDESQMAELALQADSAEGLARELYLRILSREPSADELRDFKALLEPGFDGRVVSHEKPAVPHRYRPYIAWSNHLDPAANAQRTREEAEARAGDKPTARLTGDWRRRLEDALWTLLNSPELVYLP